MIKRILLATPATLALVAANPLTAQDDNAKPVKTTSTEAPPAADPMMGMGAIFGELFKVDPLTAEQEARMPVAENVAAQLMPEGALADVLKTMISDIMSPIMEMGPPPTKRILTKGLGYDAYFSDMTDEQMEEVASLLDPSWKERAEREKNAIPEVIEEVANLMEPGVRKAMAEIFAIKFEADELAGLQSFFSTDLGAKYAREYFTMATDKRMIGASFEAMPQIMTKAGDLKAVVEQATADLPEPRDYSELTAAQQAKVRDLTGLTDAQINEGLSEAEYSAEAAAEAAAEAVEGAAEEGDEGDDEAYD